MKNSELRRLVQEYKALSAKSLKKNDAKISSKLKEMEHRYYHETGNALKSVLSTKIIK